MNTRIALRGTVALALALAAGTAAAHTGHGTESLFEGLAHPLGLDHLLAMVAVGVWSAAASGMSSASTTGKPISNARCPGAAGGCQR